MYAADAALSMEQMVRFSQRIVALYHGIGYNGEAERGRIDMNLHHKLRQLRRQNGFTQEDLAEALSVSRQTVSKWENGVSAPDLSLIPPIAAFFGVSTDTLFEYDLSQSRRNVEDIVARAARIRREHPAEAETMIREGLKKYPGNDVLLNNLLYTMDRDTRADEMMEVCNELIAATKDDEVRLDAIRILAELYHQKGERTLCAETLEMIPEIYFTKLELVAELLDGEVSRDAAEGQCLLDLESTFQMARVLEKRYQEQGNAREMDRWRQVCERLRALVRELLPEFAASDRLQDHLIPVEVHTQTEVE